MKTIKPNILQHLLLFVIAAFFLYKFYYAFGVHTVHGLCILSIIGLIVLYAILSVFTSKYIITTQGILTKSVPFARKFREINYRDIESIIVKQGFLQRRFKIGNIIIQTRHLKNTLKGIKKPFNIKELINQEKASEHERRTAIKKML